MRNKIKRIIAIFIIFIGILFLAYPYFISKITSKQIEDSINNFLEIADGAGYIDNGISNLIVSYGDNKHSDYEENFQNQSTNKNDNNNDINKSKNETKNKTTSKMYNNKRSSYNSNNSQENNKTVVESNEQISSEILDYLYTKMQEYNRNLNENGQSIVDAFSYETPSFDLTQYGLKDNIIGIIEIPKINVNLPIYLGATKENLNKGATHLSQTSIPLGGENSNAVIAAHRSLVRNPFFKNIDKLDIGDEVKIKTLWKSLTYIVTERKVISPYDSSEILIQENKDLVTLITCHPYGETSERYVVYCERKTV